MEKEFVYIPSGVCSRKMVIHYEGDIIKGLEVEGGCNGNLKGIGALLVGMKIDDVIARLDGTKCRMKNTSCPDQIAQALKALKSQQE